MTDYTFKDKDDEELNVHSYQSPRGQVASVYTNGDTVWVTADEAPKTAQAILDAAGVKGAVLTDLPTVYKTTTGRYWTKANVRWTPIADGDPYNDINTHIRGLLAIKLHMEVDAKGKDKHLGLDWGKVALEKKAEEAKKAHDDLRTSPIALKALALYNKGCIRTGPYASWDATCEGLGSADFVVMEYIRRAEKEEAKEKEAAEKLAARRDELAKELCDGTSIGPWYEAMGTVHKRAIDRIIELEGK